VSAKQAPRLCVLAPTPQLTITVEAGPRGPEIHVHFGGQGLWVAKMGVSLGADVVACGPFGGEAGDVTAYLARGAGIRIRATPAGEGSGAYVHDRRGQERVEVARMDSAPLTRHELDDLFGAVLVEALDADVVVLAGPEPAGAVPDELYARLAHDLRVGGRTVVADLAAGPMSAAAEHGLDVLKMSHTEMVEGGLAEDDSPESLIGAARRLTDKAVGAVVVSRAGDPTLVVTPEAVHEVVAPPLTVVDHRGAGDSQTAGISVGLARGYGLLDAVRLGVAAGALNVTRHGLASGARDQIERLTEEVVVRELEQAREG
jgi:1-phosphofructokinase